MTITIPNWMILAYLGIGFGQVVGLFIVDIRRGVKWWQSGDHFLWVVPLLILLWPRGAWDEWQMRRGWWQR